MGGARNRHETFDCVIRCSPTIKEIRGPDGKLLVPGDVEVKFIKDFHETAYFVAAEVYVTRLLDRTEFRKHCDQHKTFKAIITSLE